MDTQQFYGELAPFYDVVFEDWDAAMARQGEAIEGLIAAELASPRRAPTSTRVLDVACGIGTQALPLAARGFDVTARDLSPAAVARLGQEAAARPLRIDAGVADMRHVAGSAPGPFDVVLAFDNAIPHLLTDSDIRAAFTEFGRLLPTGGLCLCSVRDYDAVERGVAASHPYGERRRGGHVFRRRQEWSWVGPQHYDVELIIERDDDTGPVTALRAKARYYAIPVGRLLRLMAEAGLRDCRRLDDIIYQPVLMGRAA